MEFSKSELDKHKPHGTPHDQDIEAAARVISRLTPGAHIDVFAITDQSFARPVSLLTGLIPTEPGPLRFIDQIQISRNRLAAQLRTAAQSVKPDFQQSDVIGFLVLAGQIMRTRDGRHAVVVFSDMRNFTRELDIESPAVVPVATALQRVKQQNLIADLKDADVFVYGVHAGGKNIKYASSLEQFWRAYFIAAGAHLRVFSMFRDAPDLSGAP